LKEDLRNKTEQYNNAADEAKRLANDLETSNDKIQKVLSQLDYKDELI